MTLYRQEHRFWGAQLVAMEDNAPAHNVIITWKVRDTHILPTLSWLSWPRDLNPVEEVWRRIKNAISALAEPPSTVQTIKATVWSICAYINQPSIQAIVDTMPDLIEAVLSARVEYTRYWPTYAPVSLLIVPGPALTFFYYYFNCLPFARLQPTFLIIY